MGAGAISEFGVAAESLHHGGSGSAVHDPPGLWDGHSTEHCGLEAQGLVHMGRECVVQRQELLLSLGIERSHHAFMNIPIEPRSRALTGVMPGALVHVH